MGQKKIVHLRFSFNWPPIFSSFRCGKQESGPRHRPQNRRRSHLGSRASLGLRALRSRSFPGTSPGKRRRRSERFEKGRGPRPGETVGKSPREESRPGLFPGSLASNLGSCATCHPAHPPTGAGPPQAAPAVRRREGWGRGERSVGREGTGWQRPSVGVRPGRSPS